MSQAACQIILQDPDVATAKALALAVADDTENHDGKCPETTLQAVADAWKNAMDLTVATLSEHA